MRVELNGEDRGEGTEIAIGCEDGHTTAHCHRADQEVSIRALDTASAAKVKEPRCFFIVWSADREIGKGGQMFSKELKLWAALDPRQELLANGPDHHGATFPDQLGEFARTSVSLRVTAPQS